MDFKLSLITSTASSLQTSLSTFLEVKILKNYHLVALGSDSGQISIFQIFPTSSGASNVSNYIGPSQNIDKFQAVCKISNLAHPTSITFLKFTRNLSLLSADKNGLLILWDKSYGRTQIKTLLPSQIESFSENKQFYFLAGQFSEVLCLKKENLSVHCRLSPRLYPDWVCGIFNFKNQIVGVTVTGFLKVWYLNELTDNVSETSNTPTSSVNASETSSENSSTLQNGQILEDEVRKLTNETPISVLCNSQFLVIVSLNLVEIFQVGDFSKFYKFSTSGGSDMICGGQLFEDGNLYVFQVLGQIYKLNLTGFGGK